LASGASHWRFGNINWRTVRWIGVPGAVGAFVGANVLSGFDGEWMKPVVAGVLFALGLYIVARFAFGVSRKPVDSSHLQRRYMIPLGIVAGFVDAIGGGGWGPMTTPTLMTAGRMEPRKAVGSASASEFLVAVAASIGFLMALGREGIDFVAAGCLLAGGVVAAPLAAYLVRHLPSTVMGTVVGTLILVTNARTLMLSAGWAGPLRLAVLLTIFVVMVGITTRTFFVARTRARHYVAERAAADARDTASGPPLEIASIGPVGPAGPATPVAATEA
jgi:uncharacterized membrane protein YfcA